MVLTHTGEGHLLYWVHQTNAHLFLKHSTDTPRNNVLLAMWASLNSVSWRVKLTIASHQKLRTKALGQTLTYLLPVLGCDSKVPEVPWAPLQVAESLRKQTHWWQTTKHTLSKLPVLEHFPPTPAPLPWLSIFPTASWAPFCSSFFTSLWPFFVPSLFSLLKPQLLLP